MEHFTKQLENRIIAGLGPTNLSITDSHGSQAVIPCTLVDSSTGIDVAFLDYKSSISCHHGSTSRKKIFIVAISKSIADAIKSKSGKGSGVVENVTEAGKGEPDFHGFQAVILKDREGETFTCQTTDVRSLDTESNTCLDDDSTASDRVLGGTRVVAKYIGSEPRLYLESGEGETFKSTELGILESECDYSTARGLCGTRLVTKFIGSQPGIKHLAAGGGETFQRTDVHFLDAESDNHQGEDAHLVGGNVVVAVIPTSGKDGISQTPDVGSEKNTCHDGGSTASGGSQEGNKAKQAFMESLPSDIIQDILSRVPAESVLECKLVCKKWVTVIRRSNFASMHLMIQLNDLHDSEDCDDNIAAKVEPCLFFACCIDDPDEYISLLFHGGHLSDRFGKDGKYIYNQNLKRIYHPPMHNNPLHYHLVGSCNGLICTFQQRHLVTDPIYICNPLTREYVYLPQLVVKKVDVEDCGGRVACGFGYVRSTNEYKVVRIHYPSFASAEGNVEVYTVGSGCGWRAIGKVSYLMDSSRRNATGTHANGAIYWIAFRQIVAFDLAKEEFQLLPVPLCLRNRKGSDRCGLVVLGSHLCFHMDKLRMQIWSLKKSSRNPNEAWCMKFDIDYQAVIGARKMFMPILLTKKRQIIFLYGDSVLYCYDTETTILKMISNEASSDNFEAVEVIAHVNTFASLEAVGETSKRYTVRPCDNDGIDELGRVALGGQEIDSTRFGFR